jgi:hypothetical protein
VTRYRWPIATAPAWWVAFCLGMIDHGPRTAAWWVIVTPLVALAWWLEPRIATQSDSNTHALNEEEQP